MSASTATTGSEQEKCVRMWLAQVLADPRFESETPLQTLLGDGVALCQLANKVKKGAVPRINPASSLRFMLVVSASTPTHTSLHTQNVSHTLFPPPFF